MTRRGQQGPTPSARLLTPRRRALRYTFCFVDLNRESNEEGSPNGKASSRAIRKTGTVRKIGGHQSKYRTERSYGAVHLPKRPYVQLPEQRGQAGSPAAGPRARGVSQEIQGEVVRCIWNGSAR